MSEVTTALRFRALSDLMAYLDAAANMFGPLSPEARAKVAAAVLNPSQGTWSAANTVTITPAGTTVWQAVVEHTGYDVRARRLDGSWPSVPTALQIVLALRAALAPEGQS